MAVVISTPLFYDNIHHVATNFDENDATDDENDDDTCDANDDAGKHLVGNNENCRIAAEFRSILTSDYYNRVPSTRLTFSFSFNR